MPALHSCVTHQGAHVKRMAALVRTSARMARSAPARRFIRYTSALPFSRRLRIPQGAYKGFIVTARTFQVRGSNRWTLDLLIGRRGSLRAFSGQDTYATEHAAVDACWAWARRIIDGSARDCRVDELSAG